MVTLDWGKKEQEISVEPRVGLVSGDWLIDALYFWSSGGMFTGCKIYLTSGLLCSTVSRSDSILALEIYFNTTKSLVV